MNRAYSVLHVKAADDERREITGVATSPTPDRMGDVIEPLGVKFKNPLPLLLHHDRQKPIGTVKLQKPTDDGVDFVATIAKIDSPGALKDRTDEAWDSVKSGLIRGASIGFRPYDEESVELLRTGGVRFKKTEVLELSLVTIPANIDATILSIKSIDAMDLTTEAAAEAAKKAGEIIDQAATGRNQPGASGTSPRVRVTKDARVMTIPEQIAGLEARRAANFARMTEIQNKASGEGQTKDAAQKEEFDTLKLEVKAIDDELVDLRDMERMNIQTATRVDPTTTTTAKAASEVRGGNTAPVITIKPNVPKGTAFTRFAMCLAGAKGDSYQAISRAKSWADSTPEVELMVRNTLDWETKAAVAAGTTTDAVWAGPLAPTQTAVNEFLELLRPRTLIGRVPGFRQVPFNTAVPSQTGGGTYSWVGQGNAKPVTSATFATVTVPFAKAAGIIVLTRELVKLSTPSAEAVVRQEMIDGMAAFLDTQLVDPTVAAVASVNPASITNGAATAAASGSTAAAMRADLTARVSTFTGANIPLDGSVWLMNDSNAFAAGISLNALGQPLFPGMSQQGGSILGIPVVVSNNVGNRIILVHAPSILYADEGGVQIDASTEASLQMDSAPANPSDATTVLVSLWQRNLLGLRAERMITWIRARTAAVTYISSAAYAGT